MVCIYLCFDPWDWNAAEYLTYVFCIKVQVIKFQGLRACLPPLKPFTEWEREREKQSC